MAGVGFFDTGHRTPRTRDWSRPDDPQRANPARPETPEEKRKREWDESCRQETLRVQALAEEGRRKREAEHVKAETEKKAEQEKRALDERRAKYFRKLDSDAVMVDLAVAPHGGATSEERRALSDQMDALGLGLGSDKFSPEAWVVELLRLRIERGENEQ
jgi:FtsZ-interacting cell division protein ZipA